MNKNFPWNTASSVMLRLKSGKRFLQRCGFRQRKSIRKRIAVQSLVMFVVGWIQKPRLKNALRSKKYVSPFPAFLPSSVVICFINLDQSVFVRWNLKVVLICIFRMVKDLEHLFKCFSFVFHFLRTLFSLDFCLCPVNTKANLGTEQDKGNIPWELKGKMT